ncbi:MAG TPA: SCO2523 family variant P-loop protein [Mycobacteriales bacterium]|nr:SCO2523 family variant P-loop protein [Mycobacteriales bacterium]
MLIFATSDKGGTGRTVTGSNIMYRRALQGSDVCYVDFDFGSPTSGGVFSINSLARGTTSGSGTHSFLQGRAQRPELCNVWSSSDRTSLRNRPSGSGRLVLVPGDASSGEFSTSPDIERRCVDLFLRLEEEFEFILVDLSAGRSFATEIVLGAANAPELSTVQSRWLVFHRWTRQHIVAAEGLVRGARGLLEIGQRRGSDRESLIDAIRFVRTAIVDPNAPDLAGLRPAQLAWLRECNRELQVLAARAGLGRASVLGSVPLDPVLQWREQLITDSDVWARQVANQVTLEAFENLAGALVDKRAWERL